MKYLLSSLLVVAACAGVDPHVKLTEEWPAKVDDYDAVTAAWTRKTTMRGTYQEALRVAATFKSPEWREAHAIKDADARQLVGDARAQRLAQAQAEVAGPYEVELLVTTWDRAENDLDRGKKSAWHVVLVDESDHEIEPLEIARDKRPALIVRAEFPAFEDFAIPYIVRFPRTTPVLGEGIHRVRLRMSSERGGVQLIWQAP
jgi:hypothetical protein